MSIDPNHFRNETVEKLSLYKDLVSRMTQFGGDRITNSAEQAILEFIDLDGDTDLDGNVIEASELVTLNSTLQTIIDNPNVHIEDNGSFKRGVDIAGLPGGAAADFEFLQGIERFAEASENDLQQYFVDAMQLGTIPIIGSNFNESDLAKLFDAVKNNRTNHLEVETWSKELSRESTIYEAAYPGVDQTTLTDPQKDAAVQQFIDFFNDDTSGLFAQGYNLSDAQASLSLFDNGIDDYNKLSLYGGIKKDRDFNINTSEILLFDALLDTPEFSAINSINASGDIVPPAPPGTYTPVFDDGDPLNDTDGKFNFLLQILVGKGDSRSNIASQMKNYLFQALSTGKVPVTEKDFNYDNMMELLDVLDDPIEFNKLHTEPWIKERADLFQPVANGGIGWTEQEFRDFFNSDVDTDGDGKPDGLFEQGMSMSNARQVLALIDVKIESIQTLNKFDGIRLYANLLDDPNLNITTSTIIAFDEKLNSPEFISISSINPDGDLVPPIPPLAYTPIFEDGSIGDETDGRLNLMLQMLTGQGDANPNIASTMRAYIEQALITGKTPISEKDFTYDNIMEVIDAIGDTLETNKLYGGAWARERHPTDLVEQDKLENFLNGDDSIFPPKPGLFDKGYTLAEANKVIALYDQGISNFHQLEFYGQVIKENRFSSVSSLLQFHDMLSEPPYADLFQPPENIINVIDLDGDFDTSKVAYTPIFNDGNPLTDTDEQLNRLFELYAGIEREADLAAITTRQEELAYKQKVREQRDFMIQALVTKEVPISEKDFNYDNIIELMDAVGDTVKLNKLYTEAWIADPEREQKIFDAGYTVDEFKEFFNGNTGLPPVQGLFDQGKALSTARSVLNLFDQGIEDFDRLQLYANVFDDQFIIIASNDIIPFDALLSSPEFSSINSINPDGDIIPPAPPQVYTPIFDDGDPTDDTDGKLNFIFQIIVGKGDANRNMASEMRGYMSQALSSGEVPITEKPFSYENIMELLDVLDDPIEFNKLFTEPWANKRASLFQPVANGGIGWDRDEFIDFFNSDIDADGDGKPDGLFEQGVSLSTATQIVGLIDSKIESVQGPNRFDALELYANLLGDFGLNMTTSTIMAVDGVLNSPEFITVNSINPDGDLVPEFDALGNIISSSIFDDGNTASDVDGRLNHILQILGNKGDNNLRLASEMSATMFQAIVDNEVPITGKPFSYDNVMEIIDILDDEDALERLRIEYWAAGLNDDQLDTRGRNRDDLRNSFTTFYENSDVTTSTKLRQLYEAGLYDPYSYEFYLELFEELDLTASQVIALSSLEGGIDSEEELQYISSVSSDKIVIDTNPEPNASGNIVIDYPAQATFWADQLGIIDAPGDPAKTQFESDFTDIMAYNNSLSETAAYFLDIYTNLTDKSDFAAYKDSHLNGADGHYLKRLQEFSISEGLTTIETEELLDLLENPPLIDLEKVEDYSSNTLGLSVTDTNGLMSLVSVLPAPDIGAIEAFALGKGLTTDQVSNLTDIIEEPPYRIVRQNELLKQALTFDEIPEVGGIFNYTNIDDLLSRVQFDGTIA